jgi:predicted RNA-binding Zn ribbon-like protein
MGDMSKTNGDSETEFDLSGGILCLDFANTVSRRNVPGQTHDNLPAYNDLVSFARQAGVISPKLARELLDLSATRPTDAACALESAITLREAIYRVFAAAANTRAPKPADIELIERFATEAMTHRQINLEDGVYQWQWKREKDELLQYVLWPIAQSAAELLTSDRMSKVRECEAQSCAWLFLDESRNHSRRWCDMKVCGNREKARRHYAREKATSS